MKEEHIKPFLESARIVIEHVIHIKPTTGMLGVKDIQFIEKYISIQIGITGHMQGDIVFGLHEEAALKLVSAMMGGREVTQIDEMSHSALSELSNMISGNASTMLYNQGVRVDITPPRILQLTMFSEFIPQRALTIPLSIVGIGELEIQVLLHN